MDHAKSFAKEINAGFKEASLGNILIKYDPGTDRVLIGHMKNREIRSYYVAQPTHVTVDAWTDAVNEAARTTGKPISDLVVIQ